MISHRVITTCHATGWEAYGIRMVETFVRHWPTTVTLEIYAEGFRPKIDAPNVAVRALPAWFEAWKARHADNADAHGRDSKKFGRIALQKSKTYDYRRDAVKFGHKVAALTDAASRPGTGTGGCNLDMRTEALTDAASRPGIGVLIMCDADVITHADVTEEWLASIHPDPKSYMAWLDRRSWYPECGFVMYRENHSAHGQFMRLLRETYESDQVFKYRETHDSFVLQQLVEASMFPPPSSLSGKAGRDKSHPFVHSVLGERMDHLKGKLKAAGRTPKAEVTRREGYWR